MTDEVTPTTVPASPRPEADRSKSSYRSSAASSAAVDSRQNGGSGVQRSHLRNRKAWLEGRNRAGQTWAQRKAASVAYCPARPQRGS